jgi:rsbT co-antagonist protein RsbR
MNNFFIPKIDLSLYSDHFEQNQAKILYFASMSIILALSLAIIIPFFDILPASGMIIIIITLVIMVIGVAGCLRLLWRGHLHAAVRTLIAISLLGISTMQYGLTIESTLLFQAIFMIPVAIGGLLSGRKTLIMTYIATILLVGLILILEIAQASGSGFAVAEDRRLGLSASEAYTAWMAFVLILGVFSFFVDGMNQIVHRSLSICRQRERELETLSQSLENQVAVRTEELQQTLDAFALQSQERIRLLEENVAQHDLLLELSVPLLPVDKHSLVIPLIGAFDSERLVLVRERILTTIERSKARRVLLDVTGLSFVDEQVARGFITIVRSVNLLGAVVVVIGVRPDIAESLVALGIDLSQMHTAADLQTALTIPVR